MRVWRVVRISSALWRREVLQLLLTTAQPTAQINILRQQRAAGFPHCRFCVHQLLRSHYAQPTALAAAVWQRDCAVWQQRPTTM